MARTNAPTSAASTDIFSLKVTLRGLKPPVWRRLLVPGAMTLGELHTALQAAMGWEDCHLHVFEIAGEEYGDRRTVDDIADENRMTLKRLAQAGIVRFAYTYDFGDNWEHAITIEKQAPALKAKPLPVCIAGKRNCPPEDCGGVWGYQQLLAIVADPGHPEHAERAEWIGEEFDPDAFDLDLANAVLTARFRRR